MNALPIDAIRHVLYFVNNPFDLCAASLVCADWYAACTDGVWENMMNKAWFLPHPFTEKGGRVQPDLFDHDVPPELNQPRPDMGRSLRGKEAFSYLIQSGACMSCGYITECMMEFYHPNDQGIARLCDLCSENDCMRHDDASLEIRNYRERTGYMGFTEGKKRFFLLDKECGHAPSNDGNYPRCIFYRLGVHKYGGIDGIRKEWLRRRKIKQSAIKKATEAKKRKSECSLLPVKRIKSL